MPPTIQERMKAEQLRLAAYIEDQARRLTRVTDDEYVRNIEGGMVVFSPKEMSPTAYAFYAKTVLMQYYCEYWGAFNYEKALREGVAPKELSARQMFDRMNQEEYGHARLVWFGDGRSEVGPLAVLHIDPTLFLAAHPWAQVNLLHIFRHSGFVRWSEVIIYNHFQDRSAALQLRDYARGRFEPWSAVLRIIDDEEADHIRHGEEWFARIADTKEGHRMLQEDINKWFPHAMDVFGHPGKASRTMELMLRFGIKQKANDQARQEFVKEVSPLIERHNLTLPAWEYQDSRPFAAR